MRHNDPTQKSHKPQSNCCSAGSASSALNVVVALLTLTATLWLAPVAVVRSVRLQADQLTVRPFESLRAALSYVEGRLKPDTTYSEAQAQRGAQGAAPTARAAAPIDISGYWVSLVTDDWRWRMLTPPKGDYLYLPLNPAGRQAADNWDPAKDEAAGEQCKGYGAPSIMHLPGRLRITWEDDSTLKLEADAGTQTRVFRFTGSGSTGSDRQFGSDPANASWQGHSIAQWEFDGRGRRGRAPAEPARRGSLKTVTTRLRPGYFRKNGIPYSANAVLTEYFTTLTDNSVDYLVVTNFLEDPQYLAQPYIRSVQFKRQPDAKGWNPTACSAR
jgi:hypothetical protein